MSIANYIHISCKAIILLLFMVALIILCDREVAASHPESEAALLFLLNSPSVRVNGMGQAGVALTDEPGGYYNPAAPSFVARKRYFVSTFDLGGMKLWPGLDNDTKIYYNLFQFGFNKKLKNVRAPSTDKKSGIFVPYSVSMALSYYYTKFDYKGFSTNTKDQQQLGSSHAYDKADNFTVSVCANYFVNIGMGITYKRIKSFTPGRYDPYSDRSDEDFSGSGTAYDFGLLCRLPVIEKINSEFMIMDNFKPVLDISAGLSWNNRGDDITWSDSSSDPLPRFRKTGVACSFGVNFEKISNLNIFMVTTAFDRYTPQIKGTQTTQKDIDTMKGIELSLLETVELRAGEYDTSYSMWTRGYTIKSDGMLKLISIMNNSVAHSDKTIYTIMKHFSLSFSKFESEGLLADRSHYQVTVKF